MTDSIAANSVISPEKVTSGNIGTSVKIYSPGGVELAERTPFGDIKID